MLEKSIDVDGLTLYDNAALVIWQWEWKDDGDSAPQTVMKSHLLFKVMTSMMKMMTICH